MSRVSQWINQAVNILRQSSSCGWLRTGFKMHQRELICSPIKTVSKPQPKKTRAIHHLSHPRPPRPSQFHALNDGIAPVFSHIKYASLLPTIERNRDSRERWLFTLQDRFSRCISTHSFSSGDARLLEFEFNFRYFMETSLTFSG